MPKVLRGRQGRRLLALAVAMLLLAVPAALASEVSAPIEQLDAGLLRVMKLGKAAPFQDRFAILAPVVIRAMDLDAILQGALGPTWAGLPPDQQTVLKTAFEHYSVATYVANFDGYDGESFNLEPPAAGAEPLVRVRIVPGKGGGDTHVLDYAMRQTGGKWKAFDVKVDGFIDQVVVQQAQIKALLLMGGVPNLLDRLQGKTIELSGGAVK